MEISNLRNYVLPIGIHKFHFVVFHNRHFNLFVRYNTKNVSF